VILAFAHPCLVVNDLDKAVDFYCKMFHFSKLSDEGWHNSLGHDIATGLKNSSCKGVMLKGHNCFLEIFQFDNSSSDERNEHIPADALGIRHLAFFVDNVFDECERFSLLGGEYLGQPVGDAVYMRDPFGNIIELCEIPTPEEDPRVLPGISDLNRG